MGVRQRGRRPGARLGERRHRRVHRLRRARARSCRCGRARSSAGTWAPRSRPSTRTAGRSSTRSASWWSPSPCRRCRCSSGATTTAPATGPLLRHATRACGATATGSGSPTEGGCVIYGRSDSTLNRGGVRIGTSELYRVVEDLDQVVDSLVVDTGRLGARGPVLAVRRPGRRRRPRRRPAGHHRPPAAGRAVAPPRPRRDRGRGRGPPHPQRQEAGGAGEAHPRWASRGRPSSAPTPWPTPTRSSPSSTWLGRGRAMMTADADRRVAAQRLRPGRAPGGASGWMVERARAARAAGLDSLFVGDHHVTGSTYLQNVPILGRLLAEWGDRPAGALFLLPLWHPVLRGRAGRAPWPPGRGPVRAPGGPGRRRGPVRGDGRVARAGGSRTLEAAPRRGPPAAGGRDGHRRRAGRHPGRRGSAPCRPSRSTCGSGPARPRASTGPPAWATGGSRGRGCRSTRPGSQADLYRRAAGGPRARRPGVVAIRRDIHVGADAADAHRVADPVLAAGYRGLPPDAPHRRRAGGGGRGDPRPGPSWATPTSSSATWPTTTTRCWPRSSGWPTVRDLVNRA